jgi:hypothetical protein
VRAEKGKTLDQSYHHRSLRVTFCLLTMRSLAYTFEAVRPMLRSSGWGGTGSSAPKLFCAAGSSQANDITYSTTSSWVFGPAAARRCFSIVTQYSSAQSLSTLLRRKTETFSKLSSSCRVSCGSKKFWPWIFTRSDSSTSGEFLFQYCGQSIL